ncbi:DUF2183 domain-containing protein [Rhizophagus clarus]|uniref:DUF2183 domain-containing protein n=1 Tax=Rhizophagus clarus TaxID=94130 RepID=A0A8H3L399_9GLOM|nr:DUF2183 domain-containing protein [Rhizophagus clarus]
MNKSPRGKRVASRPNFAKFAPQHGPPDKVTEMGLFLHACEGDMNKNLIGKVDEILGPMNEVYFTVKLDSGIVATSFKPNDKVYIGEDRLLPLERFLPKPPAPKKVTKKKPAGPAGRVRGRGGHQRGGRGGGRGVGSFRGGRGRGGSFTRLNTQLFFKNKIYANELPSAMERIHFTTKAIKEKVFTSISSKKTELEINRETKEINELYVDAQTSISLQEHSTAEADTLSNLHNCILIPSYAFRVANGKWLAQVHGWAYGTSQSRKKKLVLGMARRVAGLNKDDEKSKLLEDRISMFLTKSLRNQRYKVQIVSLAHPSHMELDNDPDEISDDVCYDDDYDDENDNYDANSELSQDTRNSALANCHELYITTQEEGNGDGNHVRLLKLEALPENEGRQARPSYGFVSLIEAEGISVISDIDDTIKLTGVASGPRVALSNTFLYDLCEVPGMAEVYMDWYNKGASIHYVSNSPWQLFPMLKQFFHVKRFPPGSAHLKFYNDLVKSLLEEPGLTKSNYIKQIFEDFPRRKFILIGDSGEYDMEIYARIANRGHFHLFPRAPLQTDTDEMPLSPESLTPATPDTPLQKFFDRVEACKALVPNNAFTLFKHSQELRENKMVNREFELLLEKQRRRPSRQNTHIDLN